MPEYYKTTLIVSLTLGILLTLGFKDLYPDLESRFRAWRRTRRLHLDDSSPTHQRTRVHLNDDEAPNTTQQDNRGILHDADSDTLPLPLKRDVREGIEGTIGNTPLIRLKSLSDTLGIDILAKCEFLNGAGQSPKDRVAVSIIDAAEREGLIRPHRGDTIYEGTVGSTGISLATICRARGYKAHVCMPSDQSVEKRRLLENLGAEVSLNEPIGIVDPGHYVNRARRLAGEHNKLRRSPFRQPESGAGPSLDTRREQQREREGEGHEETKETGGLTHNPTTTPPSQQADQSRVPSKAESLDPQTLNPDLATGTSALFANQFETPHNHLAHLQTTGPEIYAQSGGNISAFVCGAGTGGTISGVALFLKPRLPQCKIVLADPQGSGLYNKVMNGVMFSATETEGRRRRHQVDSMVEGIGCNRLTGNFEAGYGRGLVDGAVRVSDRVARRMAVWLVERDGVFMGSSSAINVVGAVRVGMDLKKEREEGRERARAEGRVDGKEGDEEEEGRIAVVTILCDSGMRHLSRFWGEDVEGDDIGSMTLEELVREGE